MEIKPDAYDAKVIEKVAKQHGDYMVKMSNFHYPFCEVQTKSQQLSDKYKKAQGNFLKFKILGNYNELIFNVRTSEELSKLKCELLNASNPETNILREQQDVLSYIFSNSSATSSIKALMDMFDDKEKEIKEQELQSGYSLPPV